MNEGINDESTNTEEFLNYFLPCLILQNALIIFKITNFSFALDTAALLGGDEYLIRQILEELQRLEYNNNERRVLRWALTEVIM